MTTNLLLPASGDDLAAALLADLDPEATWIGPLRSRLAQELRTNPAHAAPVLTLPVFAPPYARGSCTSHILPTIELLQEVRQVVRGFASAGRAPRTLDRRDSTLAGAVLELLNAPKHERWPALVVRANAIARALENFRHVQARRRRWSIIRHPAITFNTRSRLTWRRMRSYADIIERGRGSDWCLVKPGRLRRQHFLAFASGEREFWALEDPWGGTLAMLSHGKLMVEEFKDLENDDAVGYRAEMLAFARRRKLRTVAKALPDAFAYDDHLDRNGQRYVEGVLNDKRCPVPLRFRLWWDGRRRRYLVSTGATDEGLPRYFLRLDCSPHAVTARLRRFGHTGPVIRGAAHPAWGGSEGELLATTLRSCWPSRCRPEHVQKALSGLRTR